VADGFAGGLFRFVEAFLFETTHRQQAEGEAVVGRGGEVLAEFLFGEIVPALLVQHEGALKLGGLVHG
jgi:hypothetical protein